MTTTEMTTDEVIQAIREGLHGRKMKPKQNSVNNLRDQCQTPPYALDPLLPYLEKYAQECQPIWEPAAGNRLLVQALHNAGHWVKEGEILRGDDFFEYEPDWWEVSVTNPPFSKKYKWLERCYALGKPFALLVPVEILGAVTAQKLMQEHGFEIMFLNNRIDFLM